MQQHRIFVVTCSISAALLVIGIALSPLFAVGVTEQLTGASDTWADFFGDMVQRIIHFFKNESYGRIALAGGIVLGGIYLWRRKRT